jgi:osmotically-inducible protein OsmY
MAQYDKYRGRHRDEDERRNQAAEDYYRRQGQPYAVSEYAGGQYEYGRGVDEEMQRIRARRRMRNDRDSDYDAGSLNYGSPSYGGVNYGEDDPFPPYRGGVWGYGHVGPSGGHDFVRSLGIEEPPMGGHYRHFRSGPRYRYQDRDMWDRASDEVASWFGDEDAAHRRRLDNFRGRGPKNYTRSSDRIREDVSDRLSDDWMVDASDIEVSVDGTEVTLNGTVPSREAKRRAEDCADSVSGITHVQNNLRVKG